MLILLVVVICETTQNEESMICDSECRAEQDLAKQCAQLWIQKRSASDTLRMSNRFGKRETETLRMSNRFGKKSSGETLRVANRFGKKSDFDSKILRIVEQL